MNKSYSKGGFTLIEILVALLIASLLATILYFSFSGISRSSAAITQHSETYRQAVIFMNQVKSDFTGTFYSTTIPYSNLDIKEKRILDEKVSLIEFTCFSHQFVGTGSRMVDILKVAYVPHISENGESIYITRKVEPGPNIPGYGEVLEETMLSGISGFTARALVGEKGIYEEWNSSERKKLPERILLSITFTGGFSIERSFPLEVNKDATPFINSGKRQSQ